MCGCTKHKQKQKKPKHRCNCHKSKGSVHKSHHHSKHHHGHKVDHHVNNRSHQKHQSHDHNCHKHNNHHNHVCEQTPVHKHQPVVPNPPTCYCGISDVTYPPQPTIITVDSFTPHPPKPAPLPSGQPLEVNPNIKVVIDVYDEEKDEYWKVDVRQDWSKENKIVRFDREDEVDISMHPLLIDI